MNSAVMSIMGDCKPTLMYEYGVFTANGLTVTITSPFWNLTGVGLGLTILM